MSKIRCRHCGHYSWSERKKLNELPCETCGEAGGLMAMPSAATLKPFVDGLSAHEGTVGPFNTTWLAWVFVLAMERAEQIEREIEVTPEMIEAGIAVFSDPEYDERWCDARRQLEAVYRAMRRLERRSEKK